jgi:hypothetical protein
VVQVSTVNEDSHGDINHKLDHLIGNREYGQLVQVGRVNNVMPVESDGILYDAFESITVAATSIGLTAALREGHTHAFITVETAPIRCRPDGQNINPTATVGHLLDAGDTLKLSHSFALENIQFIREGGSSGTIMVAYGNKRL